MVGNKIIFSYEEEKQPSRGVLRKRRSENMQKIYRRTPMPKCDFNKVASQLYWNHISAWLFSCKFAAYFQNVFSSEHLWSAASGSISWRLKQWKKKSCKQPFPIFDKSSLFNFCIFLYTLYILSSVYIILLQEEILLSVTKLLQKDTNFE